MNKTPTTTSSSKAVSFAMMDTVEAIRNYIQKIVASNSGVKVLLLDDITKEIISVVYTMSEILKHDVFLIEMLSNANREKLANISCVTFVRPTKENIQLIRSELQEPKYKDYKIFFSNILSNDGLERLAAVDKRQVIKEIFEYYADYVAIDRHTFTFNLPSYVPMVLGNFDNPVFERTCDGLISLLLSLKKKPYIRYQKSSDVCKRIAQEVQVRMEQEKSLFDSRSTPTLLILDRMEDPVTPLLCQWTYQAMVHEILGIQNNRIVVFKEEYENSKKDGNNNSTTIDIEEEKDEKAKIREKFKEIAMSSTQDSFFQENMYKNWGDLCMSVKNIVETYKTKANVKENIASIEDMQRFVTEYPEFKKFAGEVDKHVTLVHELKAYIAERKLLDVSQLEQEMVNSDNHATHLIDLKDLIKNEAVTKEDASRLVLLYALRYEQNPKNETERLLDILQDNKGVSENRIQLIQNAVKLATKTGRNSSLFGETQGGLKTIFKQIVMGGMREEINVFTQHKPLLKKTLDELFKGKLKEAQYPFTSLVSKDPPKEVIVFIAGGMTYEEALCVETDFNATGGKSVILGGSNVINSRLFMREVQKFSAGEEQMQDLL